MLMKYKGSHQSLDYYLSLKYPMIQKHLADKEESIKQAAFHQALIDSGLVKQIKHPTYEAISERQLIYVEGIPVSETIIEERG